MDDEAQSKRWLSFDPTIHAGHVITAVTIICCAVGSWYSVQSDINQLKTANIGRDKDIAEIKATAELNKQEATRKIDKMMDDQRQEVSKLRDDMNGWFMALNDKLDRKADKR